MKVLVSATLVSNFLLFYLFIYYFFNFNMFLCHSGATRDERRDGKGGKES
jgi:hypothetical protein